MQQAQTSAGLHVVDLARAPVRKSEPKRTLIMLSVLFGSLVCGICLGIFRDIRQGVTPVTQKDAAVQPLAT